MIIEESPTTFAVLDPGGKRAVSFNLQEDGQMKVITSGSPIVNKSEMEILLHWLSDALS
jgi:hypothetical protein